VIKINLVREGRAPVRGAGAAPSAVAGGPAGGGAANANNLIVLVLLVVAALLAGGYWFVKQNELKSKQAQVEVKKAEAQKLEKIIKEVEEFERRKENLEKRIETINNLKKNQKAPVQVMDRISQDLPDLVWLDQLTLKQSEIQIQGRGLNPNAIAIFIENIKTDPLFEEPEVNELSQTSAVRGADVYNFSMKFAFKFEEPKPAGANEATEGME
jgi:type IV pilus assembly protein PilN